ncbi:ABC-F family ATP-binding cassette domain-containing protein [Dellaglioa sp. P0083]|uniref:ABC-F family ATP-binding cassette domain-containing protein n=1 Tax=Dellaglioa kimchii TaxID=3344667 RepID=UPI0038D4F1FF
MILLQVQQAARYFGADVLFENANMDIKDDARIALVGRNGAGKSTLIKMIIDQEATDAGQIIKHKGMTIGYLAQTTTVSSERSIWDEMSRVFDYLKKMEIQIHTLEAQIADPKNAEDSEKFEKLLSTYDQVSHDFSEKNGYGYESEIRSVLHGFRFYEEDFNRDIRTLSGGQKTRLALAKLLLEKRDLLILDEPTNHLDIETLTWLEGYLKTYTGALLIVSHDRYFLDKIVTEVYDMSHNETTHYNGNYSQFIVKKEANLKQEWKVFEKQQDKIEKIEDFVNKNIVRASTTKRAQSRRKQLEKLDKIDRPEGDEKAPRFSFKSADESGNIVLTVSGAAVGYDNKVLSEPVSIDLHKHQVQAIVGPNGVGKSTLLKSILGQIPFIRGEAFLGANVHVGYYDQEQNQLTDKNTVLDELWNDHPSTPETDIRSLLGGFLFSGDDVLKRVSNLSGGEKARLALTKLAMDKDNFLIFDEPTNHLDIDSKEVLEKAIANFDGTVLLVSHDRYFINKVAESIIEVSKEGSTYYMGDYDYYVDKKEELEAIEAEKVALEIASSSEAPEVKPTTNYQQNKETQKEQRKLTREIDRLESELSELETHKTELEEKMSQPTIFSDADKLQELQTELQSIQTAIETAETNWEEASLALE